MNTEAKAFPRDIIKAAGDVCSAMGIPSTVANCMPIMNALVAERERCAAIADIAASGRDWQRADANAQNDKRAARDFESMKIEALEIAYAIRKGGA